MNEGPSGTSDSQSQPEERRQFVRVRKDVQVSVRIAGEAPKAYSPSTRNLGTGGLLITLRREMAVGTRLQLRATQESAGVEFCTEGRVVWCEFNGSTGKCDIGVCFLGLEPNQRRNVIAFLGMPYGEIAGRERRQFIRLDKRVLAEYRTGRRFLKRWRIASTQDVSVDGVAIIAQERLNTGTKIQMRIHLDDGINRNMKADGVVLECSRSRERPSSYVLHVRYQNSSSETQHRLADYVSRILAAPPPDSAPGL